MNLHAVKDKLLFNTLARTDVGAYLDSVDGIKRLYFKESHHGVGLAIPYNSDTVVQVSTGQAAVQSLYVINVEQYNKQCPDCHHEWMITAREDERVPGRNNSERTPKFFPYSVRQQKPVYDAATGIYTAAVQKAVADELITLISSHTGTYGSPFYASRAYKVTCNGSAEATLAASSVSGASWTTSTGSGTAAVVAADLLARINAGSVCRAVVDPSNAAVIYVMFTGTAQGNISADTVWTTETNCTAATDATGGYWIGLSAKDTTKYASIELRNDDMFTITASVKSQVATLTANDVFEEFMLTPNDGSLAAFRRRDIPSDVAFTRYYFKWREPYIASLSEGAGHYNSMWREAVVYMPTSEATSATNKWIPTNWMDETTTATANWAQLLTWWQNSLPIGKIGQATITFATDDTSGGGQATFIINGVSYVIASTNTTVTDIAHDTATWIAANTPFETTDHSSGVVTVKSATNLVTSISYNNNTYTPTTIAVALT